jgi:restriction system protein
MYAKDDLIPPHGGYRKLRSYQCAQIVYDATVIFCDRFVDKRSRTHDQMIQAARSGARNIAEGSTASATSKKTELKLTGVARASLRELLDDYRDFLRHRRLRIWPKDSTEALAVRGKYRTLESDLSDLSDPSDWSDESDTSDGSQETDPYGISTATAEVAANTLICLIHQALFLLGRQLESLEEAFLDDGGFTERMYRQRSKRRREG